MSEASEVDWIRSEAAKIEAEDGPWRCRIELGWGVVVGPESPRTDIRARELYKAVRALCGDHWLDSPVLDLGALNGAMGIPFAEAGYRVNFVEGRPANARKINLLLRSRGWVRCGLEQRDVRAMQQKDFENFDVILCCGLLYHLRADEALQLLERIASAKPQLLVLDSQFAFLNTHEVVRIAPDGSRVTFRGQYHREHEPGTTPEAKLAGSTDKSLDNDESFWFDARDIVSYLTKLGFTTILQHALVWELLPVKQGHDQPDDPRYRRMLFCYRG